MSHFKPEPTNAEVIYDMPAAEYHADPCPTPSLSSGIIGILREKSPQSAWARHPKNPLRLPRDQTKDVNFGGLTHALLLRKDEDRVVVVHEADWRKKVAQEQRDEAQAAGKTPVLAKDFHAAEYMANAAESFIYSSPLSDVWGQGKSEVTVIWREGDVWLKVRFDRLSADLSTAFDYKTTEDCAPGKWSRQMYSMGYHVQAALYLRGLRALGARNPRFIFLAQERDSHECAFFEADNAGLSVADYQIDKAVETWGECIRTGKFPSYGHRIHVATCPTWLINESEAAMAEELR